MYLPPFTYTIRTHCCENIVARDVYLRAQTGKHLLRTQNVSEQNQTFFCVPYTKFVSATNAARAGKRGNICVGNNVSSFARAFTITIDPDDDAGVEVGVRFVHAYAFLFENA